MPCLMGKDRYDFLLGMRCQQGIEENDPFCPADSGKVSIGVFASLTGIHLKYPFNPEAGFLHKGDNPFI